jgi:3',5'-cyclic AMP phosphodiesterase CpdA
MQGGEMATWTLAITADLHWGHRRGEQANEELVAFLHQQPPDLLVVAGDIGSSDNFAACLEQLADLPGRKCLVPGNHDIWVPHDSPEDSLRRYRETLPRLSRQAGFHYLDEAPLYLPEADLALVGSINWYDYSWSLDELRERFPGNEERLRSKMFTRGRHNDARFVRWPLNDASFTAEVVAVFEQQLVEALAQVPQAIVVAHHPPLRGLNVPRDAAPSLDRLLWEAFSGNTAMEQVLERHAARIPFVFCGHTHRARETTLGPHRGYNVGSDYPFKRLLLLDWPAGTVQAHTFTASDSKKDDPI